MQKNNSTHYIVVFLIGLATCFFFWIQPDYWPQHPTDYLGLILIPWIAGRGANSKFLFYGLVAFLAFVFNDGHSQVLFYLGYCTGVLAVLELLGYRFSWLPILMLLVIAPITRQLFFVWSFPLRMEMSECAGQALQFVGFTIQIEGNVVIRNGAEFSVDAACAGLKMLSLSMVFSLFIIAWFQNKQNKSMPLLAVLGFLFLTLLLAAFANFTRLLILIIFHIPPENIAHEIFGLIIFFFYVLLPIFGVGGRYVQFFGKSLGAKKVSLLFETKPTLSKVLLFLPLLFVGFIAWQKSTAEQVDFTSLSHLSLSEYEEKKLENGVLQYNQDSFLLYVKPPINSWSMPHDPRYCWQGSGWEFKRIQKTEIAAIEVYTAEIIKNNEKLKTLWWYDNGENKTINELQWRWRQLEQNEYYYLINLTAENEKLLYQEAKRLLKPN